MSQKPTYEELEQRIHDLTEREHAERNLQENEERYQTILESIQEAYFEVDLKGNFTFFNDSLSEALGYSREELKGMNNRDYMPPETAKEIFNLFNEIFRTGKPVRKYGYEVIRKDGAQRFHEMFASMIRDGKGRPIGFRGIAHDITERKQAEEALRRVGEEKYRTVLEAAPDPVIVYDIEGRVKYMNPAFTRVFGWSLEERIGKKMDDFVPDENWPETRMLIDKVMSGERFSGFETQRFTKGGRKIPVSISGSFYRDQEGEIAASVINLGDISERKMLEAQLQQAQKMEAIGTLAGGIAHDFNNLLMGMQGHTSMLLMDKDALSPDYDHLKGIEDNIKNAAGLTKQLLGIARSGKYEIKATNLNEMVSKSIDLFSRTKKEVIVHKETEKDLWTVEVDRGQIEQVLLNLYVNAWQAMSENFELHLETQNVMLDDRFVKPYGAKPGRYVKISVTDKGIGMDEQTQQRVFDPFFTTKKMSRGTGLGLASAYGIIKNHGGIITVQSQKGHGATFSIYLPTSENAVKEEAALPKELLKGSETILLIDDEEIIIEIGQQLLEALGYTVFTAKSGEEAIDIYQKSMDKIDMVILDMVMPGMGGSETYDRLKEINPDIQTLLSSGYSMSGLAKEILAKGCNGFIQKPFGIKQLSLKLREILDKK